jgi:ESAT-6 family protein
MAGYEVTAEQLRQIATEMTNKNSELQSELDKFMSAAQGAASSWQGQAATAFQQLSIAFEGDSKKLNDSLLQIAEMVNETEKGYVTQEQAAQDSMSNITGALGG